MEIFKMWELYLIVAVFAISVVLILIYYRKKCKEEYELLYQMWIDIEDRASFGCIGASAESRDEARRILYYHMDPGRFGGCLVRRWAGQLNWMMQFFQQEMETLQAIIDNSQDAQHLVALREELEKTKEKLSMEKHKNEKSEKTITQVTKTLQEM